MTLDHHDIEVRSGRVYQPEARPVRRLPIDEEPVDHRLAAAVVLFFLLGTAAVAGLGLLVRWEGRDERTLLQDMQA